MRRLGGIDSAFLGMETAAVHAHVLAVSVYDPSTSPHRFDADHAKRLLLSKLDQIPAFHRRLVTVPGDFTLPYWIEDPDFDIDQHVHEQRIAAPGGREQLADAIGELAEVQLDRRRPLWSWHVLTGLADGHVAHVAKLHHAAVDGATGVAIVHTLNTPAPDDVELGDPVPWQGDAVPSPVTMFTRGLVDVGRAPSRAMRLQRRLLAALPGMLRDRPREPAAAVRQVPQLSFNRAVTPRRSVAFTSLDFPTVRDLGKRTGSTINDIVLTVATGALRTWLSARGELPSTPMVAGVPVSTRGPEPEGQEESNQVTAVMAALPVHVADPVEQLGLVRAAMEAQKAGLRSVPSDLAEQAAAFLLPALTKAAGAAMEATRMANWVPMPFNLGISNVPGRAGASTAPVPPWSATTASVSSPTAPVSTSRSTATSTPSTCRW